jgi:putative nucleotidyltransferase with HDIG domain
MTNPFFNRGPILDPRFFFPRPRETREVLRLVAGSQNCSLVGPIKSGKTSLLLHLARPGTMAGHELASAAGGHSPIYLSFEGLGRISQEQFFHLLLRETARQACGRIAVISPRLEAGEAISFLELKEALDQLEAAGERLVFLLDEVELAARNPAFDLNFFSALRHIAARPAVCFVTATDGPLHEVEVAGREIGSPFADLFSVVRLRPVNRDDAWQWMHALAAESGVELEPEREFITDLGGGFPHHLQVVAYETFECKQGGEAGLRSGETSLRSASPLSEDERRYVGSRAYEQVEPVLTIMWERLSDPEREAALAALAEPTSAETDGFTWLVEEQAVVLDGLVRRFLSERRRDRGSLVAGALDLPGQEPGMLPRAADHDMMYGVVRVLMRAIEARDRYARGHADQVARLASGVAREMGCPQEMIAAVRVASRLHDIGRVSISDMILLKPGPLTELETEIIRTHPVVGSQILDALEFPWAVKPAVRYHHERLDGSGYPEGLVGEEIPLAARILAVAEVMAAMTSDSAYKQAASAEEALAELAANAGSKYDAAAVAALHTVVQGGLS